MKRYLGIKLFAYVFVLLVVMVFVPLVNCQDSFGANVSYGVGYGGLLWVNGTVVSNSTLFLANNTVLSLAATPTNANYSFNYFDVNGSIVTDNPYIFTVTVPENASLPVTVGFVAEAVPTPSPVPDLSVDDSVGLAVVFGLIALIGSVAVSLFLVYSRTQDKA